MRAECASNSALWARRALRRHRRAEVQRRGCRTAYASTLQCARALGITVPVDGTASGDSECEASGRASGGTLQADGSSGTGAAKHEHTGSKLQADGGSLTQHEQAGSMLQADGSASGGSSRVANPTGVRASDGTLQSNGSSCVDAAQHEHAGCALQVYMIF